MMMPNFIKEWFAGRFQMILSWTGGAPLNTIYEIYLFADGHNKVDKFIRQATEEARNDATTMACHPAARRDWLVALKRDTRSVESGRRWLWSMYGAGGRLRCAYEGFELVHKPEVT